MKSISRVVESLSGRQFKSFETYVRAGVGRKNKLEREMLLQMREGNEALEVWVGETYGNDKRSLAAYHTQRQRLATKLESFIAREIPNDQNKREAELLELLHSIRWLFVAGESSWAAALLRRAKNLANYMNDPLWQSMVFREELKWPFVHAASTPSELDDQKHTFSIRIDLDQRMALAEVRLNQMIGKYKIGESQHDPTAQLKEILSGYKLEAGQMKEVSMVHRMSVMVRRVMNAGKRFEALLAFLEVQFERINELGGFKEEELNLEVEFKYMLAHACYRNRFFEKALRVLSEVYPDLNSLPQAQEYKWFSTCVLLEAACKSFSGKNKLAIQSLNPMLEHPAFSAFPKERLNLMLNLAVYHFQQNEFYQAKTYLENLGHSTQWMINQLGREWVLKWQMIRVINFIELGENDQAYRILEKLEQESDPMYTQKVYKRVLLFLNYIRRYLKDPRPFQMSSMEAELEEVFVTGQTAEKDLQAMAYYAWLQSKASGKDYYQLLLGMVGKEA